MPPRCYCAGDVRPLAEWLVSRRPPIRHILPTKYGTDTRRYEHMLMTDTPTGGEAVT